MNIQEVLYILEYIMLGSCKCRRCIPPNLFSCLSRNKKIILPDSQ